MSKTPIQLSDGYLTTILTSKAILRNFPGVSLCSRVLNTPAVSPVEPALRLWLSSTNGCGSTSPALPSDKLKELKTMLGVGDRQFVTYVGTGRSSRKVLI
jgi:hypothetical protein